VVGFEINPSIYLLADRIKNHLIGLGLIRNNIKFILGDARLAQLGTQADMLISENLYTGMFFEKQVQITRSLSVFLKAKPVFVPSGIRSYLNLAYTSLPINNQIELRVISEIYEAPVLHSDIYEYDQIHFGNMFKDKISFIGNVTVTKTGTVNSLIISSEVMLYEDRLISRYDTIFMNNDILLLLPNKIEVNMGDVVSVKISYLYGSNPIDSVIILNRV
jgi:predicted RNA methylase